MEDFLALPASIRRARSHHEVYKIHAVHQVGMDVRAEERLLPLFWALNGYKQRQEDFPLAPMTVLRGPLPSAENAAGEFRQAMERGDRGQAEAALVALARGQGARATMEQLWQYGCRNGGTGGHMAFALTNCFRALETIGWQQAEPAVRFVIQDWFALNYVRPDRYYQPNQARVEEHLRHLPSGWAGERADRAATRELFGQIREGQAEASSALAVQQLRRGVQAQAHWDAIHLATAELLVRHNDGWGRASGALRDLPITDLRDIGLPASSEDAITEIFAQLPNRHYRWDARRGAVLRPCLPYFSEAGSRRSGNCSLCRILLIVAKRQQRVHVYVQRVVHLYGGHEAWLSTKRLRRAACHRGLKRTIDWKATNCLPIWSSMRSLSSPRGPRHFSR